MRFGYVGADEPGGAGIGGGGRGNALGFAQVDNGVRMGSREGEDSAGVRGGAVDYCPVSEWADQIVPPTRLAARGESRATIA
jgi:hypothetical protein